MIDVSIIIISYNHFNILNETIESILNNEISDKYEIIVIDNDSEEGNLHDKILKNSKIKIFQNGKNIGWPSAINQGILLANGKYILIVDNDVLFKNKLIDSFIKISNQYNDEVILAPQLLDSMGNVQHSIKDFTSIYNQFGEAFFLNYLFPKSKHFNKSHENYKIFKKIKSVEMVLGACMFFAKKQASDLLFFNNDYFFYCSDTEFCLRQKQAGMKVLYCSTQQVVHLGSISSSTVKFTMNQYYAKDFILFLRNNYSQIVTTVLAIFFLLSLLNRIFIWAIIGVITFRYKYFLKSYSLLIKFYFSVKYLIKL